MDFGVAIAAVRVVAMEGSMAGSRGMVVVDMMCSDDCKSKAGRRGKTR